MNVVLNARVAQQLYNLIQSLAGEKRGKQEGSSVKAIFTKNKLTNEFTEKLKPYTEDANKVLDLFNAKGKALQAFVKELGLEFKDNVDESGKKTVSILTESGKLATKEQVDSINEFYASSQAKFSTDEKAFCDGSYTITPKDGTGQLWVKSNKTVELELNDAEVAWLKERFEENVDGEFFHFDGDVMEVAKVLGIEVA